MNDDKLLKEIILKNDFLCELIVRASNLGIDDYYIAGGCIAQSVWNYLSNNELMYGIYDIDFIYYDKEDLTEEGENKISLLLNGLVEHNDVHINVRNEARNHLWYKEKFSEYIEPFKNLNEAVESFPTTATSIGVKFQNGEMKVYAPYGTDDLFNKIVRINAKQPDKDLFYEKVNKWVQTWTDLVVVPWDVI